jgi:MarR family transcriptional regulator, transcriptional regulator for hemolysin
MKPHDTPIGLQLAHTSKAVSRAFNDALGEAGGSIPTWLILTSLMGETWPAQHRLARAMHIEAPTLTRHLDGLEEAGLVVRRREADDRRAVRVELTDAGRAKHAELMRAVIAFDKRLRAGLSDDEISALRALLKRLEASVGSAREALAGEAG